MGFTNSLLPEKSYVNLCYQRIPLLVAVSVFIVQLIDVKWLVSLSGMFVFVWCTKCGSSWTDFRFSSVWWIIPRLCNQDTCSRYQSPVLCLKCRTVENRYNAHYESMLCRQFKCVAQLICNPDGKHPKICFMEGKVARLIDILWLLNGDVHEGNKVFL